MWMKAMGRPRCGSLEARGSCSPVLSRYFTRVSGQKNFSCALWRVLAFICLLPLAAHATTVIAPRFETLVDRAELIFTGQVLSQRAEWRNNNGERSIVTLVTFGVQQVHKGKAQPTVTLQFLGGALGNVRLEVADIPRFKVGERVVLFVEGNGSAVSPLIGFFHGRFTLQRNAAGQDEVRMYNGDSLASLGDIGRAKRLSAPTAPALSHETFAARIRERLAARGTK